jgi:hypothetical protein
MQPLDCSLVQLQVLAFFRAIFTKRSYFSCHSHLKCGSILAKCGCSTMVNTGTFRNCVEYSTRFVA